MTGLCAVWYMTGEQGAVLHPLEMCGVLHCTVSLCGTEGGILQPSVLLHIILGCHLNPPRFAPVYKTLLWFAWDKQRGWEREGGRRREKEGEGGRRRERDFSGGARPISFISSREHAGIPKDSGAKRLVAPLPTSLTQRRRRHRDLCHGNSISPPDWTPRLPRLPGS